MWQQLCFHLNIFMHTWTHQIKNTEQWEPIIINSFRIFTFFWWNNYWWKHIWWMMTEYHANAWGQIFVHYELLEMLLVCLYQLVRICHFTSLVHANSAEKGHFHDMWSLQTLTTTYSTVLWKSLVSQYFPQQIRKNLQQFTEINMQTWTEINAYLYTSLFLTLINAEFVHLSFKVSNFYDRLCSST